VRGAIRRTCWRNSHAFCDSGAHPSFHPFLQITNTQKSKQRRESIFHQLCVSARTRKRPLHILFPIFCAFCINIHTQKVKSKRAHGGRYPIWPLSFRLRAENNLIFHLITSNESNPRAAAPKQRAPEHTKTTQPTTLVFIYTCGRLTGIGSTLLER